MIQKLILARLADLENSEGTPVDVHHQKLPQQSSSEGVVFANVSTVPTYSKGGTVNQDDARYQFDIYQKLDINVQHVIDEIRTALEGYEGTYESVRYNFATVENIQNTYDENMNLHKGILDIIIRKVR